MELQLKELKLSQVYIHWQQQQKIAEENNWSYSKYLSSLSEIEIQKRHESRLKRRMKESSLPNG